jgi:multidrug efflux system outer membrane protein
VVNNYDVASAVARINAARAMLVWLAPNNFRSLMRAPIYDDARVAKRPAGALVRENSAASGTYSESSAFELDVWGRLRQQTKAARAQLRASEEDRKTVLTIVVGDVAGGYFSLLGLDSELDLAKRTLQQRRIIATHQARAAGWIGNGIGCPTG